jgi:hypothetical protein
MHVTNADKILFGIRGGMYHLSGPTTVAKVIKGVLKNV